MEKKTKHRILGLAVVIGLIVITLPFFQGKKDITLPNVSTNAPPFPDQPTVVATTTTETIDNHDVALNESSSNIGGKEEPADIIHTVKPSIISAPIPIDQPATMEPVETPKENSSSAHALLTDVSSHVSNVQNKTALAQNTSKKNAIQKIHAQQAIAANGLASINKATWVIQIGSFKNKANAMRLVNQLRAKGYKAFIQQVSNSVLGGSTRVFIGPEAKHAQARITAKQLENEMHIHGIVISYKPLTL